ncbi:MAG: DUF1818 family protein [Cyanobacteriota bacterium]|nr:DUF1818 family protein [Cyanobacteriota bacterium]
MLEREGQGWRLAWDGQRHPFPLLIGGDGWATELSAAEGQALCGAVERLLAQHQTLQDTLMEEESISLEFSGQVLVPPGEAGGDLWVTLEGDRHDWTLRFVLQPASGQRGVEGCWARGAAAAFAGACAAWVGTGALPGESTGA